MFNRVTRSLIFTAFILLLCISSLSAVSFSIGVEGGYGLSSVITSEKTYRDNTDYGIWHGGHLYIPVSVDFSEHYGIETGPRISLRSFRYIHLPYIDARVINAYLELPLLFVISSPQLFSEEHPVFFSLGVGGFVGYMIGKGENGRYMTTSTDLNGNSLFVNYNQWLSPAENDNLFEAGFMATLSCSVHVSDSFIVYGKLSSEFALTPTRKSYQENQNMMYGYSVLFSIGAMYEIGEAR